MARVARWRQAPEEGSEYHYQGDFLIADSTQEFLRRKLPCDVNFGSGLSKCGTLASGRSLFELATAKIIPRAVSLSPIGTAAGTVALLVRVECRECVGAVSWWMAGLPLLLALWFSKKLAQLEVEGIFIMWRVEITTSKTVGATRAWPGSEGLINTTPAPHSISGESMEDS